MLGRKINLVFDIDEVLADPARFPHPTATAFYQAQGLIFEAEAFDNHPHYLPVGVYAMMQWLYSLENVRVSFFSSGDHQRNQELVRQLLTKSLGEAKYAEIKHDVRVLSRDDCTRNIEDSAEDQMKLTNRLFGNKKKDIRKALHEGDVLEEAILIEDDPSYVYVDQHKNFILSPPFQSRNIYHFVNYSNINSYNDDPRNFKGLNNIFFLVGILDQVLKEHNSGEKKITDTLFELNFKDNPRYEPPIFDDNGKEEFRWPENCFLLEPTWHLYQRKEFFNRGLEILKRVDPSLEFVTTKRIHQLVSGAKPSAEGIFKPNKQDVSECQDQVNQETKSFQH